MLRIGRVYKIISTQGNECYVGSTFNTTRDRFRKHKGKYNIGQGFSVKDLFDKYGLDSCKILLIKEYEVIDRKHLEVYETLWIKKLKAINKYEPSSGILKKECVKQSNKKYYEKNKEEINQSTQKYREEHKNELKEYFRQYRETNKDRIKGRDSQKTQCECGSVVKRYSLSKHRKTKKHQKFEQSKAISPPNIEA